MTRAWRLLVGHLRGTDAERLAVLRVLVTGYAVGFLVLRAPHLWDVAGLADDAPSRWEPVGPMVAWGAPPDPATVRAVLALTIPAAAAATAGWAWRATAPLAALGTLLITSHRSSWGQVFHTDNLLVLHLLVLAVAAVVDGRPGARRTRELAPQAMAVVVVVAYVLAGWAKLRASGLDWATGDALRHHVAHDNLRKVLVGDWHSPVGAWAVAHGWVFPPLAAVSLAVELAAPVVLLGGRIRTTWIAAAWTFHLGVLALMAIVFPYQLTGVAFACCVAARPLRSTSAQPLRPVPATP